MVRVDTSSAQNAGCLQWNLAHDVPLGPAYGWIEGRARGEETETQARLVAATGGVAVCRDCKGGSVGTRGLRQQGHASHVHLPLP